MTNNLTFSDKLGRWILFLVATLTLGISLAKIASCQSAKTPEFKPNEVQMLKLQVKQKDAQIKKQALNAANAEFQAAYGALMDEENAIKKENKWPETLLFDPDKLVYSEPPKATSPSAPAAAAPDPAKKK